jgi:hypothetical protein
MFLKQPCIAAATRRTIHPELTWIKASAPTIHGSGMGLLHIILERTSTLQAVLRELRGEA